MYIEVHYMNVVSNINACDTKFKMNAILMNGFFALEIILVECEFHDFITTICIMQALQPTSHLF